MNSNLTRWSCSIYIASVSRNKFFSETNLASSKCCHKRLTLVLLLASTFANYLSLRICVIALCVFICVYTFKLIYLCKFFAHTTFAYTNERTHIHMHACMQPYILLLVLMIIITNNIYHSCTIYIIYIFSRLIDYYDTIIDVLRLH